jgi:hypothetical protein
MTLFLMRLRICLLAVLGLGVGMLAARAPIKESCGGSSEARGHGIRCTACDRACQHKDKPDPQGI